MATQVAISALPAAGLPLTGAEIVPLVQSGVTVQAASAAFSGLIFNAVSGNFAAVGGKYYAVTTSTVASVVTLPAVATVLTSGLSILIADVSRNANTNHITLSAFLGENIVLTTVTAASQVISVNGAIVLLVPISAGLWRAMLIASA